VKRKRELSLVSFDIYIHRGLGNAKEGEKEEEENS
jgi:hypothetical protein